MNDLFQQAIQHHQAGELLQAEQLYHAILQAEPDHPDVNHNLGAIAVAMNNPDLALSFFKRALEINPNYSQFWLSYLITLFDHQHFAEAETVARNFSERCPENGFVWKVLGAAIQQQGRISDALEPLKKAVELLPNAAEVHSNLGVALTFQGDLFNAEKHCLRALELDEDSAAAHSNLALVFEKLNRLDDAELLYRKAIMLENGADYHGNLAMRLLSKGDYENGWAEHQWFYHASCTNKAKPFMPKGSTPQWRGESLQDKTILIYHEQGYGDMIQFVRYAEQLKKRGATVWVFGKPALAELLKTVPWVDRVVKHGDKGRFDFWTLQLQLPYWFGTTLETVPCNVPYLFAEETKSAWWKIWLDKQIAAEKKRVGLVWAGNPTHANDAYRSIAFSELAAFEGLENITFVSLQLGEQARSEIATRLNGVTLLDASPLIQDFTDSAALLTNLDLLITVDSAPAHLAGALNLPVWVMVTKVPDWRWLLDRDDSPWYSSMRLFRQSEINNWTDVLMEMKTTLKKWCDNLPA